ncbi:MAG: phosphatase PAP2 family protein [Proteobacteria bacterium]|nr:phosphatase PAP2 family protein [Pseudomonadota bacterium]
MSDIRLGAGAPSSASTAHPEPHIQYARNVSISASLFLVAFGFALTPSLLDMPLTLSFNSLAGHYPALDLAFYNLDSSYSFSGGVLMALIWGCWFSSDNRFMRERILAGLGACLAAGIVSRLLQHSLPTHLRPFYTPAVHFRHPLYMSHWPLNKWFSFPSDHAAVFAGLLTIVWISRSKFRIPATLWLIVVESSRTYEGAHFPSDLLGGAAFAATLVWASQCPLILRMSRRVMAFEVSAPSLFYIAAFFISLQLATLFTDFRNAGSGFVKLYEHHLPISQPDANNWE